MYSRSKTKLMEAICKKNKNEIQRLISEQKDFGEYIRENGIEMNAMDFAIKMGDVETVALLLQQRKRPHKRSDDYFDYSISEPDEKLESFLYQCDQTDPNVLLCLNILCNQLKETIDAYYKEFVGTIEYMYDFDTLYKKFKEYEFSKHQRVVSASFSQQEIDFFKHFRNQSNIKDLYCKVKYYNIYKEHRDELNSLNQEIENYVITALEQTTPIPTDVIKEIIRPYDTGNHPFRFFDRKDINRQIEALKKDEVADHKASECCIIS